MDPRGSLVSQAERVAPNATDPEEPDLGNASGGMRFPGNERISRSNHGGGLFLGLAHPMKFAPGEV